MNRIVTFFRRPPRASGRNEEPAGASRGQVMIMFAFFGMAMFGIFGLAIDLGYSFAERRAVQNAADLAAIAGARAVARYSNSSTSPLITYALPEINAALAGNQLGGDTPTIEPNSCFYVDSSAVQQGACATAAGVAVPVPEAASGVRLTVQASHGTFFIRIFPGAPARVTEKASARAYVELSQNAGFNSPIIACGYKAKLYPSNTEMDILSNNNTVNPAAIGKTFRLYGTKTQIARCGTDNAAKFNQGKWGLWRGAALIGQPPGNAGREIGESWTLLSGDDTTSFSYDKNSVVGIEGCAAWTAWPYNCIMAIPITCGTAQGCAAPAGSGSVADPFTMYVTKILAFRVQQCVDPSTGAKVAKCLAGTLLDDYLLSELTYPGGGGWTRDSGGVVGIKLNNPDS